MTATRKPTGGARPGAGRKPKHLEAVLYVRTSTRTKERIAAALIEGEDSTTFIRLAVEQLLVKRERAAMQAASDARAAAHVTADRAELELRPVPEPPKETP